MLRIDSAEQLLQTLASGAPRRSLRLEIPMSRAAMEGAFFYAGGWHPFVEAIRGGRGVLKRFYDRFQPKSLGEFYGLDTNGLAQLGPRELPWLPAPRGYRGEKGLGPQHGISLFGPCTEAKTDLEHTRLTEIFASIAANGYVPDRYGDITGYFLIAQREFRFVVRGGKHRAAALAAMGWTHLPVAFKPRWVHSVSLDTVSQWPRVHDGTIAAEPARQLFERLFEWNGTQQRRQLDLA